MLDVSLYLRGDSDRLTAAFRLECQGKELVHREWVELNDGTLSEKCVKRLRACFPSWDGDIGSLEQGHCCRGVAVLVTVENEQDRTDATKWWTRTRYMDPPGGAGSGAATLPDKESRATLVSKYGARFRALAGGTPAATRSAPAAAVAAAPKPVTASVPPQAHAPVATASTSSGQAGALHSGPPPAPAKVAPTSTLEACWDALGKKHPDESREQVSERWFKMLEQVGQGKDQADFGPEDWGRVKGEILGDVLPF